MFSNQQLVQVAVQKIGRADANIFWNFFLSGFSNVEEDYNKKFAVSFYYFQMTLLINKVNVSQVIIAVLNQLNAVEVYAKQSFEIITRLFIELPKLKNDQIVELCQYCMDSLQLSDPKCVGCVISSSDIDQMSFSIWYFYPCNFYIQLERFAARVNGNNFDHAQNECERHRDERYRIQRPPYQEYYHAKMEA